MSCKKIDFKEQLREEFATSSPEDNKPNCDLDYTVCEDCSYQETIVNDTSQYAVILGAILTNPYSLTNMTTAYNYIYSDNISLVRTSHYYVRFKPISFNDLIVLDSLDVELYDYPLNRQVIQDGDYWPEAYYGLASDKYTWLYSVVEQTFSFPSGIQYEILEPLFIPDKNEVLEDEAMYITGNMECNDSLNYPQLRQQRKEYYQINRVAPCENQVVICDDNGGGGSGGGGGTTPSLLSPNGQINFKTYVANPAGRIGASAPLKFVRVVGKRFFKIDKTYTDQNGRFQFKKSFPKKVTIVVKFKTSSYQKSHSVREKFSELGAWKTWFPMKKNIGTYRGNDLQNIKYEFQKGSTSIKRKTRLWIAAVTLNTAVEANQFLSQNNLSPLPKDLRIYLAESRTQGEVPQFDFLRRSSAPLISQDQILEADILQYGVNSAFAILTAILIYTEPEFSILAAIGFLASTPQNPDINIHYRTSDINSLTATKVSISVGQQLGLAYVWNLEENSIINDDVELLYRESIGYVKDRYTLNDYSPFGNGIDNNQNYHPDVVSIRQSFAQHFAHSLTNKIYETSAESFELQGKIWSSNLSISSNLKFLEDFDPNISAPNDYFNWIPVGLINDLMDATNEQNPVVDNVSGFPFYDIQVALYNKPTTMTAFKSHLKALHSSQASQIDQLFVSYGY